MRVATLRATRPEKKRLGNPVASPFVPHNLVIEGFC